MFFLLMSTLGWSQIPINEATIEQLADIDGITETQAEQIVSLRSRLGRIENIESLRSIDISEEGLDMLRQEVVVLLPIANIGAPRAKTYASADAVLSEFGNEPTIGEVQSMAMIYSKTNPERIEGWLSSVRKAYALPKVNVQYEKELDGSTRYDYLADEAGASPVRDYEQIENDDKVVVKLEWRLDKLVMSSEQIRVLNESQKAVKVREQVMDEVTRLYFDRRRLQVEGLLNPASSLNDEIEYVLRLQEMSANLDALTGGAFSASIRK
jgi:hypothetical protein